MIFQDLRIALNSLLLILPMTGLLSPFLCSSLAKWISLMDKFLISLDLCRLYNHLRQWESSHIFHTFPKIILKFEKLKIIVKIFVNWLFSLQFTTLDSLTSQKTQISVMCSPSNSACRPVLRTSLSIVSSNPVSPTQGYYIFKFSHNH